MLFRSPLAWPKSSVLFANANENSAMSRILLENINSLRKLLTIPLVATGGICSSLNSYAALVCTVVQKYVPRVPAKPFGGVAQNSPWGGASFFSAIFGTRT